MSLTKPPRPSKGAVIRAIVAVLTPVSLGVFTNFLSAWLERDILYGLFTPEVSLIITFIILGFVLLLITFLSYRAVKPLLLRVLLRRHSLFSQPALFIVFLCLLLSSLSGFFAYPKISP